MSWRRWHSCREAGRLLRRPLVRRRRRGGGGGCRAAAASWLGRCSAAPAGWHDRCRAAVAGDGDVGWDRLAIGFLIRECVLSVPLR